MYCKECGKEIANDSKYCNYCGTIQSFESNRGKFLRSNLSKNPHFFTLKKVIIFSLIFVLATILFFLIKKHPVSNMEMVYNGKNSQIEPLEKLPIIQRTFLDCCFGDTYEKVEEKLKSNGYKIQYVQTTEWEPKRIILQPTLYSIGDFYVKYIDLRFCNNSFSFIQFVFADNASFIFKGIKHLLNKKYSNVQVDQSNESDFQTYSDEHTEIELELSIDSFNDYVVNLKYYDKRSENITLNNNF